MELLGVCLSCECLGLILVSELLLELIATKALDFIVEGALKLAGHYNLSVY